VGIFSDDRANELRALFFESAAEILQAINEDALRLEKTPRDPDLVRDLRRNVHTLKGDSAACGYKELSEAAHAVEDVMTPEVAEQNGEALAGLVLTAADLFDSLLTSFRDGLQPPSTQELRRLIAVLKNPPSEARFAPAFHWSEYERKLIATIANGQPVYNIALAVDPSCPMPTAAAQLVRNTLHEAGTIAAMHPEADVTPPPTLIEVALASDKDVAWLERRAKIPTVVSQVYIERMNLEADDDPLESAVAQPAATPAQPEAQQPFTPLENGAAVAERAAVERPRAKEERVAVATENVLRVETERVDKVLDLVGEMIIAKSMMQELQHDMLATLGKGHGTLRARSGDILTLQSQIMNKLQRAVMKIRMVPVEQMFRRLPRVARDTAKATGREVNVIIEGGNTDLDKSILDALAEPMMHLLRNAVDHGIESPEQRKLAGKPVEGTIRLNAYHQGNQVVIEIGDDGSGIDLGKVVSKAVSSNIITPDQARRMSENDALDLIFAAGLSTSDEVTEISGRGIGMDVVKSVMDRLKGTISVSSVPGQGSTFRLKVPLTLAIIKALLFRVSERLYAVPLGNVLEILRSHERDVHSVEDQEVLKIREQIVPLIRLSRMHGGSESKGKLFVVVVSLGDRKCGLVVDRLIGEQELVIKALDETMIHSAMVSGASILGDGRVVLVLSISDVVEKLGRGRVNVNGVEASL
jgi:two-component system chemotaxis sensor kinase CheA